MSRSLVGWVSYETIGTSVINARAARLDIYKEDDNGEINAADFGLPEKEEYIIVDGNLYDAIFSICPTAEELFDKWITENE